jgi:hypothetical protein
MAPVADLDFQWPTKECHAYGRLDALNGADSTQYTSFEKATYQTSSNSMLFLSFDDAWCSASSYSGSYTVQCDTCSNTMSSGNGGVVTKSSTKTTGCDEKSSKRLVSSPLATLASICQFEDLDTSCLLFPTQVYTSDDCTPGTENRSSVLFFYSPQSTFTKLAPSKQSCDSYACYGFARVNKTDGSMLPPVFEFGYQVYDSISRTSSTDTVAIQRYNDPFCVDYATAITNCSGWTWGAGCTQNLKCDTTCVSEKYSSTSRKITDCGETVSAPDSPPRPPRSPPPPLPPPFQATNINARLVNVTSSPSFYSGRLEVWSDSSGA